MTKSKTQPKSSKGRTPAKSAPLARSAKSANRNPVIRHSGNKVVVSHCEYVKDVESDLFNEFSYEVFSLSPGMANTFPWLSSIAQSYESYRFKKLNAVYKPNCSATTGGKVIFATDFDSSDAIDNETKTTLLQWEGSTDTQCWEPMTMSMSEANLNRVGPTRFIDPPSFGTADRLTSAGNFYVATTAVSSSMPTGFAGQFTVQTLGELWFEYVVELITPALTPGYGVQIPMIPDPQLAIGVNGDGEFTVPSANCLGGFQVTTTPGTPPPPQIEPNAAHVQLVNMPANTLVDVANNPITTTEKVLRFDKDFTGDLVLTYRTPAGYAPTATIPQPIVQPLRQIAPQDPAAAGGIWGLINSYVDVPNLISTVGSVVQSASASGFLQYIVKLATQKGTYLLLRDVSNLVFNWNTSIQNQARLRLTSRKYAIEDLMSGPSALPDVTPAPASRPAGSLRRRVRTTPFFERIERYKRSLASSTAPAAPASTSTNSDAADPAAVRRRRELAEAGKALIR